MSMISTPSMCATTASAKPKGAREMNREAEEIARTWANRLGFDLVRHFGAYRLVSRNPQRVISEAPGLGAIVIELDKMLEQEMRRLTGHRKRRAARERDGRPHGGAVGGAGS
jgi:hypothetical protein